MVPPPGPRFLELDALDERRKAEEARVAQREQLREDGVILAPVWIRFMRRLVPRTKRR